MYKLIDFRDNFFYAMEFLKMVKNGDIVLNKPMEIRGQLEKVDAKIFINSHLINNYIDSPVFLLKLKTMDFKELYDLDDRESYRRLAFNMILFKLLFDNSKVTTDFEYDDLNREWIVISNI